jgi:RNA polymerase sigma factor (sigma-70 family)
MASMEDHQDPMNDAGEVHAELRPLLFSIAYRMLGSIAEAEDVVQEAFLRWHRALTGGTEVDSPKAYLAAVTTRLAIDQLRASRVRRESYLGPWLPEPLVAGTEDDAARHAEMADSLSMAFLIVLESRSSPGLAAASRLGRPGSSRRRGSETSWPAGSSPPASRATWMGWWTC